MRLPRTPLIVAAACVAAIVWIAFGASLDGDFVWDDRRFLLAQDGWRGLAPRHIGWMLHDLSSGHWQPLTWYSWALDHARCGLDPRGYHVTNLVLHAANGVYVLLLTLALLRRTVPAGAASPHARIGGAALAASVFVAHPLRVESVAWITERRDMLSVFFLLPAFLCWLRSRDGERVAVAPYVAAIVLYAASLTSKAWGLTLPAVLVVVLVWPLDRVRRATLRREALLLLPFVALATVAALLALRAQSAAGAMEFAAEMSWPQRLGQAAYGLAYYPARTLAPIGLSPLHVLDTGLSPWSTRVLVGGAAVCAVTLATYLLRRRRPALATAWLTYVLLVSPVLGLAQSGFQAVADRYSYLSCVPFAVLAGAAWALWTSSRGGAVRLAPPLVLVVALILATRAYVPAWHDDVSLWTRAIQVDPANHVACVNRGTALMARGDLSGARADFEAAARLAPDLPQPYNNLGYVSASTDPPEHERALREFGEALSRDPTYGPALINRAGLLLILGRPVDAIVDLDRAIALGHGSPDALLERARARAAAGDREGAIDDAEAALRAANEAWPGRPEAAALLRSLR